MKASILTVEEVVNSVASLPVLQLLSYSTPESQLKMVCAIISMGQTSGNVGNSEIADRSILKTWENQSYQVLNFRNNHTSLDLRYLFMQKGVRVTRFLE